MALSLRELMSAPILREADVVAGEQFLDDAEIRWVAVTEPPIEEFIRPGELVLTTGMGCDDGELVELVKEIADLDAAAICFSFADTAKVTVVPDEAIELAEKLELPIISTPWEVRFAEIIMAVSDRIIAQQHAAALAEPDLLLRSVTSVAKEGAGLAAVAGALETVTSGPTLVLSPELRLLAYGKLAKERLANEIADWDSQLELLTGAQVRRLELGLGLETATWAEGISGLGIGPGLSVGARIGRRVVALIYTVLDRDTPFIPTLEGRAVTQSSIAVAMEMMRLKAAAVTEQKIRGEFISTLAEGRVSAGRELTVQATLLGYDLATRYRIVTGQLDHKSDGYDSSWAVELTDQLRASLDHTSIVSVWGERVLILMDAERHIDPAADLSEMFDSLPAEIHGAWGITSAAYSLIELSSGASRAERVRAMGASLGGPSGVVTKEEDLGVGLLLGTLADDPEATRMAEEVLKPIIDYDQETGRNLLHTLDVFIRQHGNVSAASRDLYMNRHSLMYRCRKIEELTGYSLDTYEDRFRLDLSLHILRLDRSPDA